MSSDDTRQLIEAVIQHVSDLRQEVGRNQQLINNAQWKSDNAPALEGTKASNEWLTKVIMGTQFLLDFHERNQYPWALTAVVVTSIIAATVLSSLLLAFLSNGGGH